MCQVVFEIVFVGGRGYLLEFVERFVDGWQFGNHKTSAFKHARWSFRFGFAQWTA